MKYEKSTIAGIALLGIGSAAVFSSLLRWRAGAAPVASGEWRGAEWAVYEVRRFFPLARSHGYIARARCLDVPGGEWTDMWNDERITVFPTMGAAQQRALTVADAIGCNA
jgi:hypothetical protein